MYKLIKSLSCTPETSVTLCVNYTQIKKKKKERNARKLAILADSCFAMLWLVTWHGPPRHGYRVQNSAASWRAHVSRKI